MTENTKKKSPHYQRIEETKLTYKISDNELSPIISFITMYYHYDILHANYEKGLEELRLGREIEEKYPTLEELLENLNEEEFKKLLPLEVRENIRFFGGGLLNHNFFFQNLTKFDPKQKSPQERISPELLKLIQEYVERKQILSHLKSLTSLEKLEKALIESALKVRGSGWTWLVLNKNNELEIINTEKQDGPWALRLRPLIGIDVWEHAYVIDYHGHFARKEYVKKLLTHLLNWEFINKQLY